MTPYFQIKKGVKQGCQLAPYLLLLMGEILNILIKQLMGKGNICRMVLLRRVRKQLLSQYIDDTTFNLVGNEDNR
jgi:hypothetical protein